MSRARANESLAAVPSVALRASIVDARRHVGLLHAEGVAYIVYALRQEAAFLAQKSAAGAPLSAREMHLLGELALALVALGDKGAVDRAQAMLAADEIGDQS